ncbi:hypothetical protein LOK46_10525 [Methylobacterium sp. NMS14P]|uniref:hypothetical protein n=1 Tax=Methylobacterium sp. NMS14P TaxID=2894310 RepID=UPI0023589223|nr:hypothetical protein [Methylobacterium sp. NMS14P]WCS27224.1 hypothetical protein LOK46_10525 [Methylobacterium sp. NMS14P]
MATISLRVRKVDANGDRVFGGNQAAFLRNSPEAVAQICESRLNLWTGQWYLDRTSGTPYETDVLGYRTESVRDLVMQARILETPGVSGLVAYSSTTDRNTRTFTPTAEVATIFGASNRQTAGATVRLPVEQDR